MSINIMFDTNKNGKKYCAIVFDIQEKTLLTLYYNDNNTLDKIAKNSYVVFWPVAADLPMIWYRQIVVSERRGITGDRLDGIFSKFIIASDKSEEYKRINDILHEAEKDKFDTIMPDNNEWIYSDKYQCMHRLKERKPDTTNKGTRSMDPRIKNRIREKFLQNRKKEKEEFDDE